jgi:uncharacterized protein CbrC (UPF0167 family)
MKKEIQEKLALFTTNAQSIRKEFTWHDTLVKKLAALLYTLDSKNIDCAAIKNSHTIIKNNTGIFSMFRGNMALCIAAMMSLKEDPADIFANTTTVYDMMKNVKFRASDYLIIAAYEIASQTKPEEYRQVITRTKEFYDSMKSKGFFRTGQDDYIFSAMLGLSDIDVRAGTESIEQLYQRFRKAFWSGNSVQALAQVLVLSGECETAVNRILVLRDAMKSQKIRLDRAYTLPSLGVLAILPVDVNILVSDINEAQGFLRAQKGFSIWSVSQQALLLFASAIVASAYAEDVKNGVTASVATNVASIIIAQQAAIIAAVSASTAASSAAAASR